MHYSVTFCPKSMTFGMVYAPFVILASHQYAVNYHCIAKNVNHLYNAKYGFLIKKSPVIVISLKSIVPRMDICDCKGNQ